MTEKEKLEEAKRLYQTANADQRYVLERLFPKLKESEDEKMRKSIIYALRNGGFYDNDKTDEAIAWLEKQGKQKPKKVSIWKHWKDGIAGGAEGEQIFLTKIGRIYSISSCLGCECDYIELSELDKLLQEEKQGMPKWSEEDDCYMSECISAIATKDGWSFEEKTKTKHWLNSLKQRMEE